MGWIDRCQELEEKVETLKNSNAELENLCAYLQKLVDEKNKGIEELKKKMKSIAQLREKAPYVLKRKGHAKQKKKLLKAYHGKRLKESIRAHAAFEEMTISEMKKMEFDFYRDMKGGHRHNYIYNVCNRILFRGSIVGSHLPKNPRGQNSCN